MKKWILNICSVLLVGIYLISTMGYGIHECINEGSKNLVLLYGSTPCEAIHPGHVSEASKFSHSDYSACCAHKSSHEGIDGMHDKDCCSTTTFTLTHKQLNQREVSVDPIEDNTISFMAVTAQIAYNTVILYPQPTDYTSGFKIKDYALQIVAASQIRI